MTVTAVETIDLAQVEVIDLGWVPGPPGPGALPWDEDQAYPQGRPVVFDDAVWWAKRTTVGEQPDESPDAWRAGGGGGSGLPEGGSESTPIIAWDAVGGSAAWMSISAAGIATTEDLDDAIADEVTRADAAYLPAGTRLDQIPAPTAQVDLEGQRLVDVAAPTASTDAATMGWVLDQFAAFVAGDPDLDSWGELLAWIAGADGDVQALVADVAGRMSKAANGADIPSPSAFRTNLGLGTASTHAHGDYATAAQGAKADTALQPGSIAAGHTVKDEGVALPQRAVLDVVGRGARVLDVAGETRLHIEDFAPDPELVRQANNASVPMMAGQINDQGAQSRMYLVPFYCHYEDRYLESIRSLVTVSDPAAVLRFGLYGPSDGFQLLRITDAGTVTANTTGVRQVNIAAGSRPELAVGWNHLTVSIQGGPAKLRFGTVLAATQQGLVSSLAIPAVGAYYQDAVTGALPANTIAPFSQSTVADAPWVTATIGTTP